MKNTSLRKLIAEIDGHLLQVGTEREAGADRTSFDSLGTSWASLVKLLDLGPEPEMRSCPACKGSIFRAATRCMHCWAKSAPPAVVAAE